MKKLIILLSAFLFTGCAQSYYMPYNQNSNGTAKLNIKLSAPMRNVNVTLNDSLIVEDKYTRDVTIDNIPPGTYKLKVIGVDGNRSGNINYADSVSVGPNDYKTILIETPPLSNDYWIYSGLVYLASFSISYYLFY